MKNLRDFNSFIDEKLAAIKPASITDETIFPKYEMAFSALKKLATDFEGIFPSGKATADGSREKSTMNIKFEASFCGEHNIRFELGGPIETITGESYPDSVDGYTDIILYRKGQEINPQIIKILSNYLLFERDKSKKGEGMYTAVFFATWDEIINEFMNAFQEISSLCKETPKKEIEPKKEDEEEPKQAK